MMNKSHTNIFRIFSLISSLSVFIYLIIRAIHIPIVHDEAATFFYYIQSGNFIPYYAHWDANNHILNSALSFINYTLFGNSVLVLRLANLISFPIFAFFVYKISTKLQNNTFKYLLFVSLVFTHNFIEYFAFCRGYGLSIALITGAIYFLFKYLNSNEIKDITFTLIFVNLAVLSNLTLINSAILISSILLINVFIKRENRNLTIKKFTSIFTLGLIPIALFAKLLIDFKDHNLLYYGTHEGFWDLSVQSLVKLLADNQSLIIDGIIIFIFSTIIILISFLISKTNIKSILKNANFIFPVLLFGNLIAVLLLDIILNINYPEDRTGLYFYPYFIASFIFIIDEFLKQYRFTILKFIPFILLIIPLHFVANMNTTHSSFWQTEGIPESFIKTVKSNTKNLNHTESIGGSHIRVLCWAYYNYVNKGELNQIQYSEFPEYNSDFQVVDNIEFPDWKKYYHRIAYDSISQINLLQRKNIDTLIPLYNFSRKEKITSSGEFINLIKIESDSIVYDALNIDFELMIKSPISPLDARIVLSVQNSDNEVIQYDYISLNWKQKHWDNNSNKFKGNFIVNKSSKDYQLIKVYIWNNYNSSIETSSLKVNTNYIKRIIK